MSTIAPTTRPERSAVTAAGLALTTVVVAMPLIAALTVEARGMEPDPLLWNVVMISATALITAGIMLVLVPWALRGSDRRALAVAWTCVGVAVAVAPLFFWTMVPAIAGGAAAVIGWGRRSQRGVYRALLGVGAVLVILDIAAYVATM